jgi:hypothetical protein
LGEQASSLWKDEEPSRRRNDGRSSGEQVSFLDNSSGLRALSHMSELGVEPTVPVTPMANAAFKIPQRLHAGETYSGTSQQQRRSQRFDSGELVIEDFSTSFHSSAPLRPRNVDSDPRRLNDDSGPDAGLPTLSRQRYTHSSIQTDEVENDGSEDEEYGNFGPAKKYRYDKALRAGCIVVAQLAWRHTRELQHPLAGETMHEREWKLNGRNILWSMYAPVREAIINGNLAEEFLNTHRLEPLVLFDQASEWMRESRGDAPVIYLIGLVSRDNGGTSPTPSELRQVIRLLQQYMSGEAKHIKRAIEVDAALAAQPRSTAADIKNGHQYYLCKRKAGPRRRVATRKGEVLAFCKALEERLDSLPKNAENTPLEKPLQYIGYAFNYMKRMAQHMHGESSYLIHLVNSVCQVLFPGKYNLEPFPVCFLAANSEVRLAELLLTMLADSFATNGGGFNIHMPGLNNSSADMGAWSVADAADFWAEREKFREEEHAWDCSRILEQSSRNQEEGPSQQAQLLASQHEQGEGQSTQQARLLELQDEEERFKAGFQQDVFQKLDRFNKMMKEPHMKGAEGGAIEALSEEQVAKIIQHYGAYMNEQS